MPTDARILLIEDEPLIREVMTDILEDAGYRVESAANGATALATLESTTHLPSLILMDLMLPVMDGWELYRRIHLNPRLADIPVIVLSGVAGLAGPRLFPPVAASFTKPLNVARLLEVVAVHCGRSIAAPSLDRASEGSRQAFAHAAA